MEDHGPKVTTRRAVLILGWTVGPFVVSLLVVALHAAMGWPRYAGIGFITFGVPLAFGVACAAILYRPRGWNYLLVVPYCLAYAGALVGLTIVYAIMLGAEK
jgi:hypothetical protein